jgi:acetylornithine deacetylase
MFRTIGSADEVLKVLRAIEPLVSVEEVLRVREVRLRTWPGFPSAAFPFTTDVPLLDRWGMPLLFGPGSFLMAHTAEEYVALDELQASVDAYVRLAQRCLQAP